MFGQNTMSAKSFFNAGILRTFGKIDQQEINKIDGHPERLVTQLIEQYGLHEDVARHKVDEFRAKLSKKSSYFEFTPKARVGS